jgi:hypothetical protein
VLFLKVRLTYLSVVSVKSLNVDEPPLKDLYAKVGGFVFADDVSANTLKS